jgi:phage baseplate assembly protein W
VSLVAPTKEFKDISLSFLRHPITNDISVVKNEDAIKKSVINLIKTRLGERFFNSILGSNIESYLFENAVSAALEEPIKTEISVLLKNFEPRIQVLRVIVNVVPDEPDLTITIVFNIVGVSPSQTLTFVLQPTRY